MTFVISDPVADNPGTGDNIWTIGTIAQGEVITIFINVTIYSSVILGSDLTNIATVNYTNSNGTLWPSESASAITRVGASDMGIIKTAPLFANTGEEFTYWINVTNTGGEIIHNLWVLETYPAEVSFVSSIPMPSVPWDRWNQGTLSLAIHLVYRLQFE